MTLDYGNGDKVQYTYSNKVWGVPLTVTATGDTATALATYNPLRYRGYVYDTETGLYYLQSRYYDPAVGRFINADAFASTGQGILSNNMLAYCCNSPVTSIDSAGFGKANVLQHRITTGFAFGGSGVIAYIDDQTENARGDKRFGVATVAHGGCGVVASHNALVSMGETEAFNEVLKQYNSVIFSKPGWGLIGLGPSDIADFFRGKGYSVTVTGNQEQFNALAGSADASIMYYKTPHTYQSMGISVDAYMAHLFEFHKDGSGYLGVNVGSNGMLSFASPQDFCQTYNVYDVVGIFIYKRGGIGR